MTKPKFKFKRIYEEDFDNFKPEYAESAIKLRDNYRVSGHEAADIVSEEEHDDIEYAEIMQYDEAVFIEDNDTVTIHDIESGYTNRLPFSDVFYNDPKPDSHECITGRDTLNILADAISDVGSWWCWHAGDDMLQLEFCDVQLYDETKAEKETHTADVLAVRFYGHVFAVFLDNLNDENWYLRFCDDDSILYPVDASDMAFDDEKEAASVLNDYKNRISVIDFNGTETLAAAKHILCARCASIVPDGVLFRGSTAHKSLRKELVENQQLRAVISMPSGVFKPYAGVSTAILVFTKTNAGGTDKVWFYDMKADGFSLDDKRTPIVQNDIPDIIARFKNLNGEESRERTEQSFFVPKQEIVDNGYDLSINKYKKTEYVPIEYPPTEVILAEIEKLNKQVEQETAELRKLLGL